MLGCGLWMKLKTTLSFFCSFAGFADPAVGFFLFVVFVPVVLVVQTLVVTVWVLLLWFHYCGF